MRRTGRVSSAATTRRSAPRSQTLTEERALIQEQAYIEIEARAHGLGGRQEHPFSLAPDASPLPADAPGSASAALGATAQRSAPIDAWLDLLFGPGH